MVETQQIIPGTADVPTARVEKAGDEYCEALATWQAAQKIADDTRATLIEFMEEDGIERFEVSGHEVKLVTTATTKVKVKTLQVKEE